MPFELDGGRANTRLLRLTDLVLHVPGGRSSLISQLVQRLFDHIDQRLQRGQSAFYLCQVLGLVGQTRLGRQVAGGGGGINLNQI